MSLLLLLSGSATLGIEFRDVLSDLYPKLNAVTAADLIHWSETELYEWLDEAAKRLARGIGCFVERDASITIVTSTAVYSVPARHLSTIHAAIAGRALSPNNVQEVEALDSAWVETEGVTDSFLNDNLGTDAVRVYPAPDATVTGALSLVFHRYVATINSSNHQLTAPACLGEYFSWWALSEARRKQSEAHMPEVADHFAKRVAWLEKVIEAYWGTAQ